MRWCHRFFSRSGVRAIPMAAVAAATLLVAGVDTGTARAQVHELDLAQALERAREVSPKLRQLDALRGAAAADEDAARARRSPDLAMEGRASRLSDVPELVIVRPDGGLSTIFPNITESYSARLRMAVPLYTGGQVRSSIAAAEHRLAAREADLRTGDTDLVWTVSVAYWELAVAGARRRVVTEAQSTFEAHVEDARNRQRFGLAPTHEVLAVTVERDRAELRRLRAERDYAVAEARLERLLDLPPATELVVTDALVPGEVANFDLESLIAAALAARPERAAAQFQIAAAQAGIAIAQSARRPQIQAEAGYDLARPNRRILPLVDEVNDSWDVSLNFRYTLFDGGRRGAGIARARAEVDASRQGLRELDRAIRLEVTARYLDFETARVAIQVAESAQRAATHNVQVAGDRYRQGLAPSSELLDAETALLEAGLELTLARAQLRIALAGLGRAVGTPLP